jgi:hypothetical protein
MIRYTYNSYFFFSRFSHDFTLKGTEMRSTYRISRQAIRDRPRDLIPPHPLIVFTFLSIALADQKHFWLEDTSEYNSNVDVLGTFGYKDDEFETAFAGITTFAHLPFVNCLHPAYAEEAKEKFDIAIVGAPFDTSVTYRPGYRPRLARLITIGLGLDRPGLDLGVVDYRNISTLTVGRASMVSMIGQLS